MGLFFIEGGADCEAASLQDMGVDHGGANVFVAKQFLDGADVVAILKQVGGKGVAKGVTGDAFAYASVSSGIFYGTLQTRRVEVVTAHFAPLAPGLSTLSGTRPSRSGECARVYCALGGGEDVLPGKFARRARVFQGEGVGEVDFSEAGFQVFAVKEAGTFDLALKAGDNGVGQQGNTVLFTFAIPNGDGLVFEVEVLYSQADAFHETQSASVEQLSHEPVHAFKLVDDAKGFAGGQDGGQAFRSFGVGDEDGVNVFMEYFAIKEEDGAEGLVLGGG